MKIDANRVNYKLGAGQFFSEADLGGFDIWTEWLINDEWVYSENAIDTYGYTVLFKQGYEYIISENSLIKDEI